VDDFDFDLLDLKSKFPSFKRFTELSFQDGENSFNLISLMILFFIERLGESSSIVSEDPFTFSVPDRDNRTGVECVLD